MGDDGDRVTNAGEPGADRFGQVEESGCRALAGWTTLSGRPAEHEPRHLLEEPVVRIEDPVPGMDVETA